MAAQSKGDRRSRAPKKATFRGVTRKGSGGSKNKGGRPTKYTPAMGEAIVRIMRQHGTEQLAAEAVGVDRITLAAWRDRGKNGDPVYEQLYLDMMVAKAQFLGKLMREVRAMPDLRAKIFLIERLEESLRVASRVEHSAPGGGPVQHVVFAYPVPMPLGADPASMPLPQGQVMDPSKAPPTDGEPGK